MSVPPVPAFAVGIVSRVTPRKLGKPIFGRNGISPEKGEDELGPKPGPGTSKFGRALIWG